MTALATLEHAKSVDEVVRRVAEIAESLEGTDLRELVEIAEAADLAARQAGLRRYMAIHDDADKARRALQGLAVQAERRAGRLLRDLDAEAPAAGRVGRAKSERAKAVAELGLERTKANRMVQLAEIPDEVVPVICEQLESRGKAVTTTGVIKAAKSVSAAGDYDGDEWYTPTEILDAARKVLGAIDCDPASCLVAQRQVRARAWWSKGSQSYDERARASGMTEAEATKLLGAWKGIGDIKDGRITQPIAGTVWCNPPYSIPHPFLLSIAEAYNAGRGLVKAAIMLVNVATDTAIQQRMLAASSARCWVSGRIAFLDPTGKPIKGNRYSQVVFYLGKNPAKFAAEFSRFGETKFEVKA